MNMRYTKVVILVITLFMTGFFALTRASEKEIMPKNEHVSNVQLPKLIIKTIYNTTKYDILFVDKLALDKTVMLPAGKIVEVNFIANDQNVIVLNGSMAEVMGEKAQYVFKKLDKENNPEVNQEVYFNMSMTSGGVNNGSGIVAGTFGSTVLNYYVAGKNGGCMMQSGRIDTDCQAVEFELELTINEEDVRANKFRMQVDGQVSYK